MRLQIGLGPSTLLSSVRTSCFLLRSTTSVLQNLHCKFVTYHHVQTHFYCLQIHLTHQEIFSNIHLETISSQLMPNRVQNGSKTRYSPAKLIELSNNQEPEMDHQESEFTSSEVTYQSVSQMKLSTDPIFKQSKILCALLADKNNLISTETAETRATFEMRLR